ncbi:MAG TPA: WYL domain-containing protein [Ktedonobacteraceae bacterium]|jgi:predicted DNA-binding transcriptional regulator YafY|nr:WYL domain-containing protein [Ktedonobacteraceae bacterium]
MRRETRAGRANQRRQAIFTLLHKAPQSYDEIITALNRECLLLYDHAEDSDTIARRLKYQFDLDLKVLRLQYKIKYNNKTKRYALVDAPFTLSLNQEQLAALAMISRTFDEKTFPYAGDIQDLLTSLLDQLSADQRKAVVDQSLALNIEFSEKTDYSSLDPSTFHQIKRAILHSHQLEFTYRSPREGKERRHVIEPKPLSFKNGHVYLDGWSIDYDRELHFRLDYILPGTAKMLPTPQRPRPVPRSYLLCYHLTPILARNGVSQHFADQQVEPHPDGSVTVTAEITDLFEARQLVLKYGENCVVESPPELVEQMRVVAAHFAQAYLTLGG